MIVIKVAPSMREFQVHKGLICHHSAFFRAALMGNCKESEGVVVLENEEVATVETFVLWLYTSRLFNNIDTARNRYNEIGDTTRISKQIIDAYMFGDYRGVPMFKNAAVDLLLSFYAT